MISDTLSYTKKFIHILVPYLILLTGVGNTTTLDFTDIDGVLGTATIIPSDVWNNGSKTISGFGEFNGLNATVSSTSADLDFGMEAFFVLGAGTDFFIRSNNNANTGVTTFVTFTFNQSITGSISHISYFGDAGVPEQVSISVTGAQATITDRSGASSTTGSTLTYNSASANPSFILNNLLDYANITSITFAYKCLLAQGCGSVFNGWSIDNAVPNSSTLNIEEIERFLQNVAIETASEQIKSSEFVLQEKMVFHGEMMRSSGQDKPASFLDYDLNIDANDTSFTGEGHYYQTDVLDNQYRRRVLIDSKRVHSKNQNETIILSGLYLLDMGISEKTSTQYRIGLKQSVTNQQASSLNSKAEARSYRLGGSLSHSFTDEVFGGVFGDLIYTKTNSRLETPNTEVKGYTKVFSTTGGAQLTGQYKVANKQWVKPSFAFSYNKDHLIKESFTSFSGSAATSIEPTISMPTIYRITIEPEFLYEESVTSSNINEYISINPSYACETLKTSSTSSECNFGLYTQIGQRNKISSIDNKLYFSYENLNGGPRHEYGLQIKFDL